MIAPLLGHLAKRFKPQIKHMSTIIYVEMCILTFILPLVWSRSRGITIVYKAALARLLVHLLYCSEGPGVLDVTFTAGLINSSSI